MVDDGFDFLWIEHAIFAPAYKIVDGCRRGNFVAKYGIQADDLYIVCRAIYVVVF